MSKPDSFSIPEFCNAAAWMASAHSPAATAAIQDLLAQARQQAALGQALLAGTAGGQADAWQALATGFADTWQKHLAPPPGMAAGSRYQAALQAHGAALAAIGAEAARKFSAELADGRGPPITSLRELQALWVDCGERAFTEAAHGEAFASGLAELLAAWVELKAGA